MGVFALFENVNGIPRCFYEKPFLFLGDRGPNLFSGREFDIFLVPSHLSSFAWDGTATFQPHIFDVVLPFPFLEGKGKVAVFVVLGEDLVDDVIGERSCVD